MTAAGWDPRAGRAPLALPGFRPPTRPSAAPAVPRPGPARPTQTTRSGISGRGLPRLHASRGLEPRFGATGDSANWHHTLPKESVAHAPSVQSARPHLEGLPDVPGADDAGEHPAVAVGHHQQHIPGPDDRGAGA